MCEGFNINGYYTNNLISCTMDKNMVYSDLCNVIKDVNTLSELALCKLNDVDFPVPFAKAYYKFKKNLEKED